ncbi:MAG: hypothetical protein KGJ88_09785 [Verrucomicrobiota bacterium]|nr:hypothetical protein [Verrucomicrobiota bacterium]
MKSRGETIQPDLERFKKYCSHSGRKGWEGVFLGFGVVSAQSQGFQTCSLAEALPKHQKSPLRTATLFFKTLWRGKAVSQPPQSKTTSDLRAAIVRASGSVYGQPLEKAFHCLATRPSSPARPKWHRPGLAKTPKILAPNGHIIF